MGIFAIANNKGGIGKTTSVINIGAALTKFDKKVLLVDFDPQANLSKSLGFRECTNTLTDVILQGKRLNVERFSDNLHVLPATMALTRVEQQLDPAQGDHHVLKEILQSIETDYDVILIDCPPALNILTTSALTAATHLLIPVQAEFLALEGLASFYDAIKKIQKRINTKLEIGGLFVTRYDQRKVLNRHVLETLSERFSEYLLPTTIRENITLAEAPVNRTDVFSYAPKSYGAEDYQMLARDILHKLEESTVTSPKAINQLDYKK
mgnify:CR=1 FL=1